MCIRDSLTWDLVLRHPDRFAAAAPMVGGPRLQIAAGQNNVRYLENVAHLPLRDLQGSRDDPILLFTLRHVFGRLEELGAADAELIEFPELGHTFELGAVDWREFLGSAEREPVPAEVVRLASDLDEARASWVEITKFGRDVAEEFQPKVKASQWNALDDNGKRLFLNDEAEQRTARLAATLVEPGTIRAEGEGVSKFRVLLTPAMLDGDGRVTVTFNGKRRKKRPRPDAEVLLEEFVERFDRTFLPTAELQLP